MGISSIDDTDYFVLQRNTNGDRKTYKLSWEDFKQIIDDYVESDGINPPNIVYTTSDYTIQSSDDVIVTKANCSITWPVIASGLKKVAIVSVAGTATMVPQGGDTIDTASLSAGQSKTFFGDTEDSIWRSGL